MQVEATKGRVLMVISLRVCEWRHKMNNHHNMDEANGL
jgi:hypothetical protein